ncbi:MAG: hypothetical protein M9963_06345 [Kiritimatiellae bacterium]|nr:hypothetical protein [Kiritimatiellia bacterium]
MSDGFHNRAFGMRLLYLALALMVVFYARPVDADCAHAESDPAACWVAPCCVSACVPSDVAGYGIAREQESRRAFSWESAHNTGISLVSRPFEPPRS